MPEFEEGYDMISIWQCVAARIVVDFALKVMFFQGGRYGSRGG